MNEPAKEVDCPYCDGKAKLASNKEDITYKGVPLKVDILYYRCDSCTLEFTTDESDTVYMNNLQKEYEWRAQS